MYYAGGILHRDISTENIIIMPKNDRTDQATGRLIDLDHAKLADSSRELKFINIDQERFRELEIYCNFVLKLPISKNVIEKYLQFDARSVVYIGDVLETRQTYFDLEAGQTGDEINLADFGWDKKVSCLQFFVRLLTISQVQNPPDFTKHKPRSGKQTVRCFIP